MTGTAVPMSAAVLEAGPTITITMDLARALMALTHGGVDQVEQAVAAVVWTSDAEAADTIMSGEE